MTTATHTVEALGQTWTFAAADKAMRHRYCSRIKAHARRTLAGDKATMDAEMYRDALGCLHDRIDSGDYAWGDDHNPTRCGSAIQAMLGCTHGQVWLLQELLRPAHGDLAVEKVLEIVTERPDAVRVALLAAFGLPDLPETNAP